MKTLLAIFLMLFAATAAFPAPSAHSSCEMTTAKMRGMTMAPERQHPDGSCCDSNKDCAQACDMVCAPTAVAPMMAGVEPTRSLRLEAVASRQPQLTSLIFTTTDPPPKTAG
jgi:hypothetical protein